MQDVTTLLAEMYILHIVAHINCETRKTATGLKIRLWNTIVAGHTGQSRFSRDIALMLTKDNGHMHQSIDCNHTST